MWRQIFGIAAYMIIVIALILFTGAWTFNLEFNYTDERFENGEPTGKGKLFAIVFHTFVFMQLFNEINSRRVGKREFNVFFKIGANPFFVGMLSAIFFLQILFDTQLSRLAGVVTLTQKEYLSCFLIGASVLLPAFLLKLIDTEKLQIFDGLLNEKENQEKDPFVSRLKAFSKKSEGKIGIDQDVIKENPEFSDHLEVPSQDKLKEKLLEKEEEDEESRK